MKKKMILALSLVVLLLLAMVVFFDRYLSSGFAASLNDISINNSSMKIFSVAFQNNGDIPVRFTCDGEDVSPPLSVADVPAGTVSLVLIVDDPDAPSKTWLHWTVWNIDPGTADIAENSVPAGAQEGMTDFGGIGWGGPCPPRGTHSYRFRLFALDRMLDLPAEAELDELKQAMAGHIVAQAELNGKYRRD